MSWNRARWVTETREIADAKNDPRWGADTVLAVLGSVHLREWRRLLDHQPTLRMQTLSLTRDAQGRVPWADLSTGSGDACKKVHRILSVYDGELWYEPEEYRLSPLAGDLTNGAGVPRPIYRREGDYLQVAPVTAGSLSVVVSHVPTAMHALSGDTAEPTWIDDYEWVIVFEAGSRMLRKGGAETQASNELAALAAQFREDLYSALGRESHDTRRMLLGDDPATWGSL